MGRLDIDDDLEGVWLKRQALRIAAHEAQPLHVMLFPAKADAGGIQVQRGVAPGLPGPCQVTRPAAMAAADFENIFSAQGHLRGDVMIELDARAVGFIAGCQRDAQRRLLFVGVVQ